MTALPPAGPPVLDVADLSVSIAGREVVQSLSFALARGERLGIIGESGSGKSLSALALLGLLPEGAQASGRVDLEGRPLLGLPERALARIRGREVGMVFQDPRTALNPVRRIGDQMSEALRIHERLSRRAARAEACELAALVGLPEPALIIDRYPHQLSGGQRQRVGIAAALACRPKVLIADEPTTALDVTIQADILRLFAELVSDIGTALIFITHDLGVLAQISSSALVMAQGRVVERGLVRDLLARPVHPVTAGLVRAARATSWSAAPGAPG